MFKKIIIFLAVITAAGIGVYYYWLGADTQPPVDTQSRDRVLAELQEFSIENQDLTEEQKQKYFDLFQAERDALQKAIKVVNEQGELQKATLYWPVLNLGNIHRDVGAYDKAKAAYLVAHEIQPGAYPPLGNLADVYFRYLKDPASAEPYFLMVIEIESDTLETYYSELYEIYRFHYKDQAKAEKLLLDGIEKYPNLTNLLALLGAHYKELGQTDQAIAAYEKLLERNPDSVVARQALEQLKP